MAIQYVCAFAILATELTLFALISLPLPSKYRGPLLRALSTPFHSESVQIGIKCTFGFIAIMFADSVSRVNKVTNELTLRDGVDLQKGAVLRSEIQSRRFYAQRNMYLTGFCLFLSLVVYRTYALVFELLEMKEKIRVLEKEGASQSVLDKIKALEEEKEALIAKSKALNEDL